MDATRESEMFEKALAHISRNLQRSFLSEFSKIERNNLKLLRNTSLKENIGAPCGCVRINSQVMNQNIKHS